MRVDLILEGRETNDGRFFAEGAITPRAPRLPVLMQYRWDEVIGWASDFQRSEDGVISVDIKFRPGVYEEQVTEKKMVAVPELRAVKAYKSSPTSTHFITSGELAAIAYVYTGIGWKDPS